MGLTLTLAIAAAAVEDPIDWSQDALTLNDDGSALTHERRFAVQAGRFRNLEQAEEAAAALRARNYDPYIYTAPDAGGGVWHAVRLEIFNSFKDAFVAAHAFRHAADVPASVALENDVSALPVDDAVFFVQAAAFRTESSARRGLPAQREKGYTPGLVTLLDAKGGEWVMLHAGVVTDLADAIDLAARYEEETGVRCYIVVMREDLFRKRSLPVPPAPESEPEPAPTPSPQPEAESAPAPEPAPEPAPTPSPQPEAESAPAPEPAPKPAPTPSPQPEAESAPEASSEPEVDADAADQAAPTRPRPDAPQDLFPPKPDTP